MSKLGIDVSKLKYGMKVDIEIEESWWGDDFPDICIATGLTCTARGVQGARRGCSAQRQVPGQGGPAARLAVEPAIANDAIAKVSAFVDKLDAIGTIADVKPA